MTWGLVAVTCPNCGTELAVPVDVSYVCVGGYGTVGFRTQEIAHTCSPVLAEEKEPVT